MRGVTRCSSCWDCRRTRAPSGTAAPVPLPPRRWRGRGRRRSLLRRAGGRKRPASAWGEPARCRAELRGPAERRGTNGTAGAERRGTRRDLGAESRRAGAAAAAAAAAPRAIAVVAGAAVLSGRAAAGAGAAPRGAANGGRRGGLRRAGLRCATRRALKAPSPLGGSAQSASVTAGRPAVGRAQRPDEDPTGPAFPVGMSHPR